MQLQLTVRQTGTPPTARDETHHFERFPLVIGRSSKCDLVLRDEGRFVSSNHAVVSLVDGALHIRDTSANGVFINNASEALGRGNETLLRDRDVVGVGDFTLLVTLASDVQAKPHDPFDELLNESPPAGSASPDSGGTTDTGYDPWLGDEPDWPVSMDEPNGTDAVRPADRHDPFAPESSATDDEWADWPSSSGSPPAASKDAPRAVRSSSGARHAGGRTEAAADPLRERLLLRCIEGLMALLRSRSELKQAMRTDVTALRGSGNNPLKFSRDGHEALTRLLDPTARGEYLAPEEALAQAIDDLALHQVAMLEGMKGAIDALLARFDPDSLTEQLTADHPIAANIPVTRDAKLWQLFREHYSGIEQAARGDFSAVFGREFRKAYETRIRELGREPEPW